MYVKVYKMNVSVSIVFFLYILIYVHVQAIGGYVWFVFRGLHSLYMSLPLDFYSQDLFGISLHVDVSGPR